MKAKLTELQNEKIREKNEKIRKKNKIILKK